MKKFKRNVLLSLLAILCVPVTALAVKTAGDNALAETVPVEGGTATEAVVGQVTLDSFAMQDGAQVRKTAPTGIRFLTDISSADLAKLPENAQFGTLIIPETVLGENTLEKTTENVMDLKAKVWKETGATNVFTGVLVGAVSNGAETDFPVAYYNEPIVARSYVTYTDSQENEYTVYATNGQTRSVAYVASKALAENETDENGTLKNIVDTVIGDGFSVTSNKTILFTGDSAYQLAVNGDQGLFVDFQSSNDQIVDVTDDGKVTGIAAGEATVTATLGSVSYEFKFKVSAPIAQDSDWNIVSEENLANGAAKYYINSLGTETAGNELSVQLLSETNAVGGRTSGIYYKVDPSRHFAQEHRFVLKPSQDKSVYEAISANAVLKFDVYFEVYAEQTSKLYRLYSINGQTSNKQTEEKEWNTFTIPMSTLLTNWDKLVSPAANLNDKNIALFTIAGTYSGASPEVNYWIGNFRVADYTAALEGQDSTYHVVSPDKITADKVQYFVNSGAKEAADNLTVEVLKEGNVVGGRTSGAYYKIFDWDWAVQNQGITVKPDGEKSTYEAYSANAVLKFDLYIDIPFGIPTYDLRNGSVFGKGISGSAKIQTWHTFEYSVADLLTNWDAIQNETLLTFNLSPKYFEENLGGVAYIGNFRIVDPDIAS
ncbi:MAG: Ig-like domain-containing protein [Clostridia bacterium]|nr:Ig-like domain-containing protein [Clostridia bacterium]